MRVRLNEVVGHILSKTEVTKSVNRNNAEHCVLFEAVNLLIKQVRRLPRALRRLLKCRGALSPDHCRAALPFHLPLRTG